MGLRRYKYRSYLGFFFLLGTIKLQAQKIAENNSFSFTQIIEDIFPLEDYDVNYEDLYDRLLSLYRNPQDINLISYDELQSLYFLSEEQIQSFLNYRKKYKRFHTIYELGYIKFWDQSTILFFLNFVRIESRNTQQINRKFFSKRPHHEINFIYSQVLEQKTGYLPIDTNSISSPTNKYLGNPSRLFFKYLLHEPSKYSLGFIAEKDPGERIIFDAASNQYGMDYYAFHIQIQNQGIVKKLILGDFTFAKGQGLVFGSGFRMGKGIESIRTVIRPAFGLRPYNSVYEIKDYSGAAVNLTKNQFDLNTFVSITRRDATIKIDTNIIDDPYFETIKKSGLHRTPKDILNKKSVTEKNIGINLEWHGKDDKLKLGGNALITNYSTGLIKETDNYQHSINHPKTLAHQSVYGNISFRNAYIFSEFAMDNRLENGLIIGALLQPLSEIQLAFLARNYSSGYINLHANSFGENVVSNNEQGFYFGIKIKPSFRTIFTGYFDTFKQLVPNSSTTSLSTGYNWMASFTYLPNSKFQIKSFVRKKHKTRDYSINSKIPNSFNYSKIVGSIGAIGHMTERLNLSCRIDYSYFSFSNNKTTGSSTYLGINYNWKYIQVSARTTLFNTPDYNNRIYLHEQNVSGLLSYPSYSGQGNAFYILLKIALIHNAQMAVRLHRVYFYNQNTIGSGLEMIHSNQKNLLTFQLKINL